MKLEKVKREFIRYMEEAHGGDPYPRNFFGCLLSIIIEPEPVSQDRIMELTGYSQATVSMTIQKIQLLMPIRTIKRVGERKHYYEYDYPNRFVLDLLQKRVDVQDIDTRLVLAMLEKVKVESGRSSFFKRFKDYLSNMFLYLSLIHEIRSASAGLFKPVLEAGSLDGVNLQDASVLEKGELADFLVQLKESSSEYDWIPPADESVPSEYLLLKNEYFSSIKSGLNPLYSQTLANQLVVIHSVLLESSTTQEQIEHSTLLPRSTISEMLAKAVERGVIKVTKKRGSRVKLYQPAISFFDLMLSYFDRAASYILIMKNRLSEFVLETRRIRPVSKESNKFLDFLVTLERAYTFTLAFSGNMKVEMVSRLKDEYEQGFVFI